MPRGLRDSFAIVRVRDFRFLLLGNVMMSAGFQIRQMAQAWLVLDQTGSSLKAGIVNAMPSIAVFTSLYGGTILDRGDRRRVLALARLSLTFCLLTSAILVAFGVVQWWHLVVVGLALSLAFTFQDPANQSLVMDVVGRDRLMNAASVTSVISNIASIIAPAIGGLLLALGIHWAFWLLVVIYSVSFLSVLPVRTRTASVRPMPNVLSEMGSGLRYAARSPAIKWLLILGFGFLFTGIAMSMIPIFARNVFDVGEVGFGTMLTIQGLGSLVGAVALTFAGQVRHGGLLILANMVLAGTFLLLFGLTTSYPLALTALFVTGLTQGVMFITLPTTLQRNSAPEMRGRVMGMFFMVVPLLQFGWVVGGALNSAIGTRETVVAAGAGVLALACLALASSKVLRREM
jgi:MFS family permease